MKARNRPHPLAALGLALAIGVLCASTAWSETNTSVTGGAAGKKTKVTFKWNFPPCGQWEQINNGTTNGHVPCTLFGPYVRSPMLMGCAIPPADFYAQVRQEGGCIGDDVLEYSLAQGVATGGSGLGTSARTDTVFAKDSIWVRYTTTTNSVTLNNFRGELRANLGRPGGEQGSRVVFTLAVYADTSAAQNDPNHLGVGALFYGRVVAERRLQGSMQLSGGFVSGDWTLTNNADRSISVTPAGTLSKTVTVPNGNNACVVLTGDTQSGLTLPGTSAPAVWALSLLLLGTGYWFMASRARSRAA